MKWQRQEKRARVKNLESKGICADISSMNEEYIQNELGDISNIDVIIGRPPCLGFSKVGTRDINDPSKKIKSSFG